MTDKFIMKLINAVFEPDGQNSEMMEDEGYKYDEEKADKLLRAMATAVCNDFMAVKTSIINS